MNKMRSLKALLGLTELAFTLTLTYCPADISAESSWGIDTVPRNEKVEAALKNYRFDFTICDPEKPADITITVEPAQVWGMDIKMPVDNVRLASGVMAYFIELAQQAYKDLEMLEAHVARIMYEDDDKLMAEALKAACFFVKNPAFLPNAAEALVIELIPTYLCLTGCNEQHVQKGYQSPYPAKQETLPSILIKLANGDVLEIQQSIGDQQDAPQNTCIQILDQDGAIASSPYAMIISEAIKTMMVPRIKAAIPDVIVPCERYFEKALSQLLKSLLDMQGKRVALTAAGITLPEMPTSLSSHLFSDVPAHKAGQSKTTGNDNARP